MKKKIINFYHDNKVFCFVFFLSILLHILAFISLGMKYNINSDDVRYLESGITLFKEGTLNLYGTKTIQIMPGLPLFIAIIYGICRHKITTIIIIKICGQTKKNIKFSNVFI